MTDLKNTHDSTKQEITINKIVDPNDPTVFRVSEEDAEKLRNLAMQNSGGQIPAEVADTLGMPTDYEQKIPAKLHNHICYSAAQQETERYAKEASKFTDTIVQDNATKEILDEAEATTNLSKFDFGDISEYLKKLETLSFLEAVSYKKKVDAEIARWKSCKSMLKAISDLRLDDSVNRELMKINAMENYEFTESLEDFENHYEENLDKLNQIATKLIEIVNSHKHEMDSTQFLTNEMCHLMEGKLAKLDPSDMNYEYTKARMETVLLAFKNRQDVSYLENKLKSYLQSNKSNIRKDFKDNAGAIHNNQRTKVIKDLIRFFNEDIVYSLYERLMSAFHDNVSAVYVMMGFIAKVMNREKKSSNDVWAKVFVLNLSDIYNGIYDIELVNTEYFMTRVNRVFYPQLKKFVNDNKLTNKLSYGVTFGLNESPRKNVNTESDAYANDLVAGPLTSHHE